jgi:glycosyltransferase involved in cell wall biosynthesis
MTKILTVMSCHNAEATVARAVESVKHQDGYLLAVDDCSTDGTAKAVQDAAADWHVVLRLHEKADNWQRVLAAMVRGAAIGGRTHVLGLGADDMLLPNCIETMEKYDADIIWGDYYFTNWRHQAIGVSTCGYALPLQLDGGEVAERLSASDDPFGEVWRPSGVACAVRRDLWLDMMLNKRAYELGPHSDTIALNLLACQRGATFIPQKLAAFTLRHKDGKKSYSQASNAGGERPAYYRKAIEYIEAHGDGVSREAKDGILRKWFPDLHKP